MRKITLLIASLFIAIGAMAQISGVNRIPTERVDPSNKLETGYYLLKQVNNNASAAGGLGEGWIKAANEAEGASVTSKNTGTPSDNDPTYIWHVEVVNADNNWIIISTANKVAAWQTPWQGVKNLVAYDGRAILKYHAGSVDLPNDSHLAATPNEGSFFISDQYTNAFVHFSGDNLGSWNDTNSGSMFMVEFYKLSDEALVRAFTSESGKLYRIKNRCKDLSYLYATDNDHSNRGNGYGAYLSSTKRVIEGCQFLKSENEGDYKTCEIRCDNATLADAGSVWKFEEAANGWKIKNMNNGSYIGATRNGDYVEFVKESDKAAIFSITKSGDGDYVTLYSAGYNNGTDNYLHASGAGLMVYNAGDPASHWTIEPATQLEVKLNAYTNNNDRGGANNGYYASLYLPFDVTFDSNVISVNTVEVQGTSAILKAQETLPANSGVIVKGNDGTYTFGIPGTVSESLSDNDLSGTNVDLALGENNFDDYYVLGKDEYDVLGLCTPSSSVAKIPANRAYLPASIGGSVNALRFDLGETTAIENVVTEKGNAPIYDLTGRRVLNTAKGGIYIQNGKKFIVK